MAGATLTNKQAILQDAFGGLYSALNEYTPVFSMIEESSQTLDGRKLRENILHGRPMGGGAKGPNAASVGDPTTTKNSETYIYPTYHYHQISIAWDVWKKSSGKHSYVSAVEQETRQLGIANKVQLERQALGDGSGRLGIVADADPDSDGAGVAMKFTVTGRDNKVFFEVGQRIQFCDGGGDFNAFEMRDNPSQGYYEIDAVTASSTAVTVTCTSSSLRPSGDPAQAGDTVIVADTIAFNVISSNTLNAGNEMNGLKGIIDDGNHPVLTNTEDGFPGTATFQNIDATTNGYWQASATDGTGSYLDLDLVTDAADDLSIHGSGAGAEDVKYVVAHHVQIRKYLNSLFPQERYPNTGATGKFNSGASSTFNRGEGPMIGERKTIKSRYCDKSIAYLVGPGVKRYSLKKYDFADMDGSMWSKDPTNKPAYIATAYTYLQMGTCRRNASARIENLTTS